MSEKNTFDQLYSGLRALSKVSFPKKCSTCNKVFETAESYIKETLSVPTHKSGLSVSYDPIDQINLVELYRNCTCGSTLMDIFNDRRDLTSIGDKRRKIFEKTLTLLIKSGWNRNESRMEILKLMKGEVSDKLQKLGFAPQFSPNKVSKKHGFSNEKGFTKQRRTYKS